MINNMTLQELLLRLSKNKNISVECFCVDEKCTITIKEWFTFDELIKVEVDLNQEVINTDKFWFFL